MLNNIYNNSISLQNTPTSIQNTPTSTQNTPTSIQNIPTFIKNAHFISKYHDVKTKQQLPFSLKISLPNSHQITSFPHQSLTRPNPGRSQRRSKVGNMTAPSPYLQHIA